MAQEIKRKHKLGTTIQDSSFGQGHSWLFEGEGDPSTGTSLQIQLLNDINAPIGSKFLDLATGTSYVKSDSTPDEPRGLYKIGVWVASSGGGGGGGTWGSITGNVADQADLQGLLDDKVAIATNPTKTVKGAIKADYDATTSTLEISIDGTDIL